VKQIEQLENQQYYGQLANAYLKIYHEDDANKGLQILERVTENPATSDKLESYLLMFELDKSFGSLEHQISSIDKIFLLQTNFTPQEAVLLTHIYTRALVNH